MSLARVLKKQARPITSQTHTPRFQSSSSTVSKSENPQSSAQAAPAAIDEVESDLVAADTVSGAPSELRHRAVRIFQPTRNTMQSGGAKGDKWRIDWDVLQGAGRWQNPLMGWASSADYMQGTRISFSTKEDAIRFAEKQGWNYYVQRPTVERIPPKNYSENFVYKPNKLRIARTK